MILRIPEPGTLMLQPGSTPVIGMYLGTEPHTRFHDLNHLVAWFFPFEGHPEPMRIARYTEHFVLAFLELA